MKGPMRWLMVTEHDEQQNYHRKGTPEWIKLYLKLLKDYRYLALNDAQRSHIIGLYLLAAELQNRIPYDKEYIASAIHARTKLDIPRLIDSGLVQERFDNTQGNGAALPGNSPLLPGAEGEKETAEGEEREQHSAPARAALTLHVPSAPPTEEEDEPALAELMGPEGMVAVREYLQQANPSTRLRWQREMLKIIGPATGLLPVDLEGALTDALIVDPPAKSPTALRAFALRRKGERRKLEAEDDGEGQPERIRRATSKAYGHSRQNTASGMVLATIREMVGTHTTPNGTIKFIRAADVQALGQRAFTAYRAIGGSERILSTRPDQLGLLLRDWEQQYAAAPADDDAVAT